MAKFLYLTLNVNCVTILFLVFFLISFARGKTTEQGKTYQKFNKNETTRNGTKDLKYMLLWTRQDYYPFSVLGKGQSEFIKNGCPAVNCYVTSNRRMFKGNVTKFDAVAFNGINISKNDSPEKRSPHQKYIYFNTESAKNYPVCEEIHDNFFNWTATYRLDSDIPYRYISIKNATGDIVGPKINMKWMKKRRLKKKTLNKLYIKLKNKTKAVAWFVSDCNAKSDRRKITTKNLRKHLKLHNLTLDVYGACGTKKFPKSDQKCTAMLQNDYYFYLSLENSNSEDYVTEKLLTAVNNFAIPVVYGGANYSRFLPPFSYIDGNTMSPQNVAALMHRLIQSPKMYLDYMWWKEHYSYHEHQGFCALCAALNNKTMLEERSVYKNFRKWWYPQYKDECSKDKNVTDSFMESVTVVLRKALLNVYIKMASLMG